MASIYARTAKINNAVGRSNYINNEERQEEIVLRKKNMKYSWKEHSDFEKAHQKTNIPNNEALEVHIALPNELAQDRVKLEHVCDDLTNEIVGKNKDYEYAVHWNHTRTNLHVHILFSERENQTTIEPKIYKKDIWKDKDTHRLAKANAENAELVHRKGEIQKDKDGNIKYQTDIFCPKDKKFVQQKWIHEKNRIIESVLKSYGYKLDYQDKDSPYFAQKKLYKGASKDYINKAIEWNIQVHRYNERIKFHIELEPFQLKNYKAIKEEVLKNVKEANKESKKITPRAIELIREMAEWARTTLFKVEQSVVFSFIKVQTMEDWQKIKNKFTELFKDKKHLEQKIEKHKRIIKNQEFLDKELTKTIKEKEQIISSIEKEKTIEERRKKRNYGIER